MHREKITDCRFLAALDVPKGQALTVWYGKCPSEGVPEPNPSRHNGRTPRADSRIALNRGGTVSYQTQFSNRHIAFVRDFNLKGAFFYSKFRPDLNSDIEVVFTVPEASTYRRFVGRGQVVRIEDTRSGLTGIAARFSRCEVIPEKPPSVQSISEAWPNPA
jgi:hypothetical protein